MALKKFVGGYISMNESQISFQVMNSKFYANLSGHSVLLAKNKPNTFFIVSQPDIRFVFSKNFDQDKSGVIVISSNEPEVIKQYKLTFGPTEKSMQSYTGEYYSAKLDIRFKIVLQDHQLLLTNNKNIDAKLTLAGENDMMINLWWMPHLIVVRNTNNTIQGIELNSPLARLLRFTKVK
jgi:hypothetical protein